MEKEDKQNTVHETVEEKMSKKTVEEETKKKISEESSPEKKEGLSDDEIIDINKEEKKASEKSTEVLTQAHKKNAPKSTEDFIKKQKKRKKTRRLVILLIIVALVVAGVMWIKNKAKKAMEALQAMSANSIETAFVEQKTLYDTKNATGTLYALESRTLSTNLGTGVATIEAVNVEVGDYVQEGDVLVKFSTENIEKTISETKEDINTQRQQDSIDAEDAQRDYVYSYSSAATKLQSAAKKVDDALFDLHEACDGYGTAKRERDEIQNDIDTMDDDEFLNKYKTSKDMVKENKLKTAQSAVDQAFQTQEKAQKAYDQAVEDQALAINDSQTNSLSKADSTYKKSQITSGQQVKKLERSLENSIDSLDDYVVTATISGIVTDVNVTEGNKFASGNVLTIQDDSSYKAEVTVDEYDIPKVKKAYEQAKNEGRELKVVVKTDATGEAEFAGHVTAIAPTSTSTVAVSATTTVSSNGATTTVSSGSTANYKVDIILDERDEALMIGMSAKVAIVVAESPENSLCVPYNTVKETDDGRFIVRVMDENGDHSTAEDSMPNANFSNNSNGKGGKAGNSDKEGKPDGSNGIVVENDDSGDKSNKKDDKSSGLSALSSKLGKKDKEPVEQGRRYREVEVEKIFETDFYAAVVPKVPGSLKAGDEVMIVTDKASGNDIMAMFGGMEGERR